MELAAVLSAMATAGLESFSDTNDYYAEQDVMRVFYLSAVCLLGRAFRNALVRLDLVPAFKEALMDLGSQL